MVLTVCSSTPSFGQPDPNDQPKAQNPNPQMPFGNWQELQKLPPEERRAAMRQIAERVLRDAMTWTRYTDKTLQDAVVVAAMEREAALDTVREKHLAVARGLMDKAVNDEQVMALVADYQTSIEEAKTRRAASLVTLDEKIQFSQKPKLAALLSFIGVTGDESALLGGIMGNVMGAMANMAAAQPPAGQQE